MYWLLSPEKITDPAKIRGLNKGIAKTLGADHVFDLSRILRLPGFYNQKHPEEKLTCKIIEEHFYPEKLYSLSDFEGYFISADEKSIPSINIKDTNAEIPPRFWELIKSDPLMEATWEGARI